MGGLDPSMCTSMYIDKKIQSSSQGRAGVHVVALRLCLCAGFTGLHGVVTQTRIKTV